MYDRYSRFWRRQRWYALVAGVLYSLGAYSALLGQEAHVDGSAIISESIPYVVTLRAYNQSGAEIGLGSGFLLENGRIATSLHVVSGADWVEVLSSDGVLMGTSRYAEAISASMDLAILPRIANEPGGLSLRRTEASAGTRVWVIGAPEGLGGTVSSGVVSAVRRVDGRRYIQISAPVSHGSSGGPILDRYGNVIGVVTGILEGGQNLNFGVPASALAVLRAAEPLRIPFPGAAEPGSITTSHASNGGANVWEQLLGLAVELSIPTFESGELSSNDPDVEGKYLDIFKLAGVVGMSVEVSAISSQFDTYLAILSTDDLSSGVDDPWTIEDDDSGSGTNAVLNFTFPASGPYLLLVTSYEAGEYGEYTLTIRDAAGEPRAGGHELDDRWHYVGNSVDGTRFWIDIETFERDGEYVDVWHHTKSSGLQRTSDGIEYNATTSLFRYDCDRRRSVFLAGSFYYDRRMVDSVEGSDIFPDWNPIIPGSVAESIFNTVCESL